MMNTDYRRTNSWDFRLRAAKLGELVSVRSLAALSLTVALLALLALLATLATLLAPPLQAQSLTTFVSNTDLSVHHSSGSFLAQSFKTGTNAGGYTVSEVDMRLDFVLERSTAVKIRKGHGGAPGDLVTALMNPASLTANSFNTFKAPDGTKLAANTTYWLTVGEGITSYKAQVSATDGSDQTGEPGWTIGNRGLYRLEETDSWSSDAFPLLIMIKGTISTDATLSSLALEGADGGETITLSPAFTANTETYTAAVVNRIDAVKLTATKKDDNATVVITNDDDPATREEAKLDLNVGSNTLTVTVTAQNGDTLTYTVTVERHTADTLVSNTHLSVGGFSTAILAQNFRTGANELGYTVSEVDIRLFNVSDNDTSVNIREDDAGEPGNLVDTLTNPASLTPVSLNTFTAPAGTKLAANTTYWLTVGEGITSNRAQVSANDGNDETGEPGWTIGNDRLQRNDEADSWSTTTISLLITIKGTTLSNDVTLSDLVLEGADGGETITLSPAFAANQYTYMAAVVNSVDEITIAPTVNHSNAEYEIEDGGGNALTDTDLNETGFQVALSEGTNTLTVTVTAQDVDATLTYTVTVERHTADTLVSNTHLGSTDSDTAFQAQSFRTGTNAAGYTVSEVDIHLGNPSNKSTSVRIRENNANNRPGNLVATLTNPASLTLSRNTFTAPAVITLAANTTYWISVNEGIISSSRAHVRSVSGNDEVGEPGLTIGNGLLWRRFETHSWVALNYSLVIAIKGAAVPTITLVSNTHLSWTSSETALLAQSFRTGTNKARYTFSYVHIPLGNALGKSTRVKIRENDASNEPGVLVATLASPGTLLSFNLNRFTAPAGTKLAANTTYWLTVNEGISSPNRARVSANDGNDETGEPGWTIGDGRLWRTDGTDSWSTHNSSLLMAIKCTIACHTPNIVATGQPTISGAPQVGKVLEARKGNIDDTNGLPSGTFPSGYTLEWVRVNASNIETIVGTNTNYTVLSTDMGSTFRVEVGFTDGAGFSETVVSDAVGPVVAANSDCPADSDWRSTLTMGYISGTTSGMFLQRFGFDADSGLGIIYPPVTITHERVQHNVRAIDRVLLTFRSMVVTHTLTFAVAGGALPDSTVLNLGGTELTIGPHSQIPTTGREQWNLLALDLNPIWVRGQEMSVCANLPPGLLKNPSVGGTYLVLPYDQDLDTGSTPAASAYAVKVDGNAGTAPTSVSVAGSTVTLTLATAVTAANTVTLSYTAPASNPVQDGSGLAALSFTDKAVSVQTANLVLSSSSLTVDEEGTSTFTVKLDTQPSGEVIVTVTSDDTGAATVFPASLTFTTTNWNTTQMVTVSGAYDSDIATESVTVTVSAAGGRYAGKTATVNVTVTDNDTAHTVPGPPTGLSATASGQTQINLSWNAPDSDGGSAIIGYKIEVSQDGGSNWSDLVSNTGNASRTYYHTGLAAGDTRHYRVSAINRVNTGLASAVASGQTQAAGAKPKRPGTMYIYFTVSDTDLNESEEATYTGNSIEGDCSREKYFRAYWIEKNNPPVDEWEVRAEHDDDVSDLRTQVRYSNGNREHPEFIGSARFAAGPDKTSSIHFAVRGRYGATWGAWGSTSVLQCKHTE